jgi:tRNA (cytidine32/uridine32-2'-O)-methyltransferase
VTERRLRLPIHDSVGFVLSRPHYPENVGACARALKTMGFDGLILFKPSRLAVPEHEMAFKMAVKSWDVLYGAKRAGTLDDAIDGADLVLATTSRRGVSGILSPRSAAAELVELAERGGRARILFGNEKTGLSEDELARATRFVRIPMVADQPSINLAQAVQIVAYELLATALERRAPAAP